MAEKNLGFGDGCFLQRNLGFGVGYGYRKTLEYNSYAHDDQGDNPRPHRTKWDYI